MKTIEDSVRGTLTGASVKHQEARQAIQKKVDPFIFIKAFHFDEAIRKPNPSKTVKRARAWMDDTKTIKAFVGIIAAGLLAGPLVSLDGVLPKTVGIISLSMVPGVYIFALIMKLIDERNRTEINWHVSRVVADDFDEVANELKKNSYELSAAVEKLWAGTYELIMNLEKTLDQAALVRKRIAQTRYKNMRLNHADRTVMANLEAIYTILAEMRVTAWELNEARDKAETTQAWEEITSNGPLNITGSAQENIRSGLSTLKWKRSSAYLDIQD